MKCAARAPWLLPWEPRALLYPSIDFAFDGQGDHRSTPFHANRHMMRGRRSAFIVPGWLQLGCDAGRASRFT